MYRFRLIDHDSGADLGPLVSQRLVFAPGESIARRYGERFEIVRTIEPEDESFRAYLVVRPVSLDSSASAQSRERVLPQTVASLDSSSSPRAGRPADTDHAATRPAKVRTDSS